MIAAPGAARARTGAAALLVLGLGIAGCAPHLLRPVELTPGVREGRYRSALAAREALGAAVDAELLLWAEVRSASSLPGVEGRLLLAGPDAFRLRIGSLFGSAFDFGGRGESLSAYVPSRHRGLKVDARRDSLGIARPGGLAFRALSAAWRPPDRAWWAAAWRDSQWCVRWTEDADTLSVAIGSDGLPALASFARPGGAGVEVSYRRWDRSTETAWPTLLVIDDRGGGFRLTCKVTRLRFPPRLEPVRLAVRIPPGAERLTLADLRRAMERLGGP